MGGGTGDLVEPIGGQCPGQSRAPDGRVVRPTLLATPQPVVGLGEPPGPGRQIGAAQPDTVVLGCLAPVFFQDLSYPLGRERLALEEPEIAEDLDPSRRPLPLLLE